MTDIDKTIEEAWRRNASAAALPANLRFDESWERLAGESSPAHAAFCAYRDYGPERNIRKAVETALAGGGGTDKGKAEKRYRMWRGWAAQFRWRERAADYDRYLDRLKQTELRKTIEEQGRAHRMVTGKMLEVVTKKLDLMNPADLTQGAVTEWVETAIRAEREAAGLAAPGGCRPAGGLAGPKQGEINFAPEFEGL
jgi:hypothetical protein